MDRRYKESRFYNGIRASNTSADRSDRLVRSYLAQARKQNASSQSFGGSTGGKSSIGGGTAVITSRNTDIKDAREIFRTEGSGSFGGRSNLAEIRGFRQPRDAASTPAAG